MVVKEMSTKSKINFSFKSSPYKNRKRRPIKTVGSVCYMMQSAVCWSGVWTNKIHKSIITTAIIIREKFQKFQTLNLLGHNGTKQGYLWCVCDSDTPGYTTNTWINKFGPLWQHISDTIDKNCWYLSTYFVGKPKIYHSKSWKWIPV